MDLYIHIHTYWWLYLCLFVCLCVCRRICILTIKMSLHTHNLILKTHTYYYAHFVMYTCKGKFLLFACVETTSLWKQKV